MKIILFFFEEIVCEKYKSSAIAIKTRHANTSEK
jgi:hypothetical protein